MRLSNFSLKRTVRTCFVLAGWVSPFILGFYHGWRIAVAVVLASVFMAIWIWACGGMFRTKGD